MSLKTRLGDLITAIATDYKQIMSRIGDTSALTTTNKTSLVLALNEVNAKPSGAGGAAIADGDSGTSTTTTYSASKISALNAAQDTVIAGKANSSHTHDLSQITDANLKADASAVVNLTGAQTVSGVKTFSVAPVVPDNSFAIAKTNGLTAALAAKAEILDTAAITDATKTWSAKRTNDQIEAAKTLLTGGASAAFDTFKELQDLMVADDTETAGIITALGLRLRVDGVSQSISAANAAVARTSIDAAQASAIGDPDTDLVALYVAAKA